MKERIFKNWRTSLVGVLLFGISTTALFSKIATFGEFVAFLPICLGFIYVKDTVFKI